MINNFMSLYYQEAQFFNSIIDSHHYDFFFLRPNFRIYETIIMQNCFFKKHRSFDLNVFLNDSYFSF